MRVNIDEIKDHGLVREWDLSRDQVDEMVKGDAAGYKATAAAHVRAELRRVERRVLFHGKTSAALESECGRCLVPVPATVPVEFTLTLVPDNEYDDALPGADEAPSKPRSASFREDAAEEDVYHGKEIDLDPLVREQLVLALPEYPVCREGCKGLCSVCGANLNERECGCDRHVPDPRWAALKNVKV
jgi:uncharacterized protein